LFRQYYHRQLWDPETAALVNGQPIYRSALEAMMRAGLNPRAQVGGRGADLTIRQILERLINEELIRQRAQAAGLEIHESELAVYVELVKSAWPCQSDRPPSICQNPSGPEMTRFLQAVRQRQQLEKIAQKVIAANWRPSGPKWRSFWRAWLARMPKSPIYRAKVLFAQAGEGVEELIEANWRKNLPLSELEVKIRLAGFTTLMSRVISINPLDPQTRAMFGRADLLTSLAPPTGVGPPYLTPAFRLPNSWAVLEVQAIRPTPDPNQLARAARKAYERQAGQEAFDLWVEELKKEATIVINPNYPDLGPLKVSQSEPAPRATGP
jgi:hypothetical protein